MIFFSVAAPPGSNTTGFHPGSVESIPPADGDRGSRVQSVQPVVDGSAAVRLEGGYCCSVSGLGGGSGSPAAPGRWGYLAPAGPPELDTVIP